MEQITLLNYSREAEEEKKQGLLEGQDNPQPKAQPMTNQGYSALQTDSHPPAASLEKTPSPAAETEKDGKSTPARADEHTVGNIDLNYSYYRFNSGDQYVEVKKNALAQLTGKAIGKETVFQNKNDGSKIHVHKNKIAIDNTPDNITAALDIAQDKGWTAINIKGGSKQAKAELWFQAQMRGLDTRGYKPNEQDMKRLLGAQERERQAQEEKLAKQAEKLTENLDIKAKAPEPSPEKPAEKPQEKAPAAKQPAPAEKQNTDPQQSPPAVTVDPNIKAAKTPEAPEKQKTSESAVKPTAEKEKDASADERIAAARKEIMNEVEKYFPLDEKEYQALDKEIEQQLTYAVKGGKGDLNKIKNDIKKGLPMVRQELDQAAKLEQSKAIQQAEKSGQTTSKNPAVHAAAKASEVRRPKTERER